MAAAKISKPDTRVIVRVESSLFIGGSVSVKVPRGKTGYDIRKMAIGRARREKLIVPGTYVSPDQHQKFLIHGPGI